LSTEPTKEETHKSGSKKKVMPGIQDFGREKTLILYLKPSHFIMISSHSNCNA
jgi:hypothetical protein